MPLRGMGEGNADGGMVRGAIRGRSELRDDAIGNRLILAALRQGDVHDGPPVVMRVSGLPSTPMHGGRPIP